MSGVQPLLFKPVDLFRRPISDSWMEFQGGVEVYLYTLLEFQSWQDTWMAVRAREGDMLEKGIKKGEQNLLQQRLDIASGRGRIWPRPNWHKPTVSCCGSGG